MHHHSQLSMPLVPVLLSHELALVLRVLLNIMYLIVETVHQDCDGDKAEWRAMRQTFRAELGRTLGVLPEGLAWELSLEGFGWVLLLLGVLIPLSHFQVPLCTTTSHLPSCYLGW